MAGGSGGALRASGFTMVELMVTIAILAILAAIAFPSFTSLINSNRLAGASNELIGAFQFARGEAIRRNRTITFCKSADGDACAGAGAGAWTGWVVRDGARVLQSGVLKSPLTMQASPAITQNSIVFRPDGFMRNGATPNGNVLGAGLSVCIPTASLPENIRFVSIAGGSRVAIERRSGATCPVPGNV